MAGARRWTKSGPPDNACGKPSILEVLTASTRFVLVAPSHPGNVGAAARAIKVMGFTELLLVGPRDPQVLMHDDAVAMAAGGADVLASARSFATLAEALHGIDWACATAMTAREFGPPTAAPRPHLAELATCGRRVAFVFGPERTGLANDDVQRCQVCLEIPSAPGYGSLNLAQAVQVIAYEWRQALGGFGGGLAAPAAAWADHAEIDGLIAHWREVLVAIGYVDPAAPKKLLPRLQQLASRLQLTPEEVHILRGIAAAVRAPRRRGTAARPQQD
jgi:tRNA/rRNA methyltransferase